MQEGRLFFRLVYLLVQTGHYAHQKMFLEHGRASPAREKWLHHHPLEAGGAARPCPEMTRTGPHLPCLIEGAVIAAAAFADTFPAHTGLEHCDVQKS